MSTTTTTTSTAPAATTTTCSGARLYQLPGTAPSCGIPNTEAYKTTFESCVTPAEVREYYDGCAIYAPAVNQSVQELIDCLFEGGVQWVDVWCRGVGNDTAAETEIGSADDTPGFGSGGEGEGDDDSGEDGNGNDINAAAGGKSLGISDVLTLGMLGMLASGMLFAL